MVCILAKKVKKNTNNCVVICACDNLYSAYIENGHDCCYYISHTVQSTKNQKVRVQRSSLEKRYFNENLI